MSARWGFACSADQVLITGGTQQAIDLVVQAVLSEGDILVTESPTYLGMIDIARTRRVQIRGICMDQEGMRLDVLENFIIDNHPRLIYVMPTFQNPTGRVMPLHRRRQLINLATEYNVPILEDGVYHEFRYEGESAAAAQGAGRQRNRDPCQRFHQESAAGDAHRLLDRRWAALRAAGARQAGGGYFDAGAEPARDPPAARARRAGAAAWNATTARLHRRRDVALAAAARHLPPGSQWKIPQGGLYLWVELPKAGPTAAELYISAIQMGVAYAIGNVFYTNGSGTLPDADEFRAQKPADIEEGFKRLGRAWRELACDYAEMEKAPMI